MEMEQTDQPISDPHVTSCQELDEKYMEAQKAAVGHVIQQMDVIAERTSERDEKLIRGTKILEQKLAREKMAVVAITASEKTLWEKTKKEIKNMELLHHQSNEKISHVEILERALEYKRQMNTATLHADPVFKLLLQELRLKHQLEGLGVHVMPPRDTDDQSDI